MKRRQFASLLGASALPSLGAWPAWAQAPGECGVPIARQDDWAVAAPNDDALIDRQPCCALADRLATLGDPNVHAVVVVRGGKLVFERYFKGADQVPGPLFGLFGPRVRTVAFDADTLHSVKSVSKSVASLVVGIALDRGLIRSVDEPVFAFFPELADLRTPEKDRILLRHALTMTLGLQWVEATPATEESNDESRMHTAADPCRYLLGLASTAPPGEAFFYNTGALSLVSAIVRKATGRPLDEFARATLFEPLGITDVQWNRVRGDTDAGGGLRLRPRDMAKIGQLVLANGRWNERQIVSPAWIEASTTPKIEATEGQHYGYLWWLGRVNADGRMARTIGAQGRGGQYIRIVPELDLVVAVTAGYYQDYSVQAFRTQYGVFRDVVRAAMSPRSS